MNVVGGGIFFLFGFLYLAFAIGIIVAIVVAVWSLVRGARALERIATAVEKRPPSA
ncbi:MAG TPA: hypothetical protein VGG90_05190 [Candidatus Dormibacteraeota bacterium]